MKQSLILTVLLLLLCHFNINAQNDRFGVSLSPTFSWLEPKDEETIETRGNRGGFAYGFVYERSLGKKDRFFLNSGLFMTPNGGNYKAEFDSVGVAKVKYRMRNYEIPFNLKYMSKPRGMKQKLRIYGLAGLTPSLMLRSRYDMEEAGIDNEKAKKFTKPIQAFISWGGGIEYALGENTSFFTSLYLSNGLIKAVNDANDRAFNAANFGFRTGIFF